MGNELQIVVSNNKENIETLLKYGYEKRGGSVAYKRETIVVIPSRKWFWESTETVGISTAIMS